MPHNDAGGASPALPPRAARGQAGGVREGAEYGFDQWGGGERTGAGAGGEIVDRLKSLIGESAEFERGVEGNESIVPERGWHAIAIQRSGGMGTGVDRERETNRAGD